jgi:serine/threonine-protein kinase
MVVGTAEYLAPEQASGQAHDDPRSEIYSLAVLAYEMITGRPPFTHPKAAEVLLRHVRDRPPPPGTIRRDLPPAAEAAILKGLEKDPAARFDDALSFSKAFLQGLAGIGAPEAPAPESRSKAKRSAPNVARVPSGVDSAAVAAADTLDPDADGPEGNDSRVSRADTMPEVPRKSLLFQIVIGVVLGAALAAGAWQLLLALE